MKMENVNKLILQSFGHTADELDCSDSNTGISLVFENYNRSNPTELLQSFVRCCTSDEFEIIRNELHKYSSTNF